MSQEVLKPSWKGQLIAFTFGILMLLLMSEMIMRVLMPNWQDFNSTRFMRVITVPGHGDVMTGLPKFDGYFSQNNGDFRVNIKINDFGLRNNEQVDKANGRIWVVGDSMTFGWGVEEDQIYSSIISDRLEIKTFNIASPGTDICGYQALLHRMPNQQMPKVVVMGLILENDIHEYDCAERARQAEMQTKKAPPKLLFGGSLLKIKMFLTRNLATYNFIAVSLKRVDVIREILNRIGIIRDAKTYRNPLSGGDFDKTVKASVDEIEKFSKMLPDKIPFLVVIAPGRFELYNGDPLYSKLRKEIGQALNNRQISFVDPFQSFIKAGYDPTHFTHDGHWTALGHKLAGEAAAQRISELLENNQ